MSVDLKNYNLLDHAEKLYEDGNFESALKHYEICFLHDPHNTKLLNLAGVCLASQGKYEEAFVYLDEAVKISSNEPTYLTNLGNCLLYLKKPAEALPYFERALEIDNNNPLYLAHLAGCQGIIGVKAFSSNLKRAFFMATDLKLPTNSPTMQTIMMLSDAHQIKLT